MSALALSLSHLLKVNLSTPVLINIPDHLVNCLVLRLKPKRLHGSLELLGVNGATAISIKQVERLADLLDLLLAEAGALVSLGGLSLGGSARLKLRAKCAFACERKDVTGKLEREGPEELCDRPMREKTQRFLLRPRFRLSEEK